jgi:two-component sensor histidine kinase
MGVTWVGLGRAEAGSRASVDLAVRSQAIRLGLRLGWLSIALVAAVLALDSEARGRGLLAVLTLAAGLCHSTATVIPWREWLRRRSGQALLDLWSALLICFIAVLAVRAGSSFSLLLFVALPFIATVQSGWRRAFWLAASGATCIGAAVIASLPLIATAMRLGLVAAVVAATLALVSTLRRQIVGIELERARAREADHRVKNSLQVAADLLLLARPEGRAACSFDDAAARLRSIAAVHRLLTVSAGEVDARALLADIAAAGPADIAVDAAPIALDAATAQKVGIVANELITNAARHGAPPIRVELSSLGRGRARLRVHDGGNSRPGAAALGLELVRQTAEAGLYGSFELDRPPSGGTRAEVTFRVSRCES